MRRAWLGGTAEAVRSRVPELSRLLQVAVCRGGQRTEVAPTRSFVLEESPSSLSPSCMAAVLVSAGWLSSCPLRVLPEGGCWCLKFQVQVSSVVRTRDIRPSGSRSQVLRAPCCCVGASPRPRAFLQQTVGWSTSLPTATLPAVPLGCVLRSACGCGICSASAVVFWLIQLDGPVSGGVRGVRGSGFSYSAYLRLIQKAIQGGF